MNTIKTGDLVAFFAGHISDLEVTVGRVVLAKDGKVSVQTDEYTMCPVPINEVFAIANADYLLGRDVPDSDGGE
jgi:hypothetical protein